MKAYFLSGLGADERAFGKITLPHGFEPVYIEWIDPQPGETLAQYSIRIADNITEKEEFILVGLSFGGMVASEIAKIRNPRKLIIISSIACSDELPWYFKKAGSIGLQKVIPIKLLKAGTVLRRIMGVGTSEDKAIIYEYVRSVDPKFLRWSLTAIVNWRHHERFPQLIHIHGSKDHLLPCKHVKPNYTIDKAGHLMVLNRAEEVNKVLMQVLKSC